MILYFTSTGNSLYAAKQLDNKLVSIPQALRTGQLSFEDETIGIVAPDYGAELPDIVCRFLKMATLKADYIYLLVTYGCSEWGVCNWGVEYAEKCGIHIQYANTILMADNWLPAFDMTNEAQFTEKCAGCGTCVKVCPVGNIKVENGKAVRISRWCERCFGCVHACPQEAIILDSEINRDARYRNENISLSEIIEANNQNL